MNKVLHQDISDIDKKKNILKAYSVILQLNNTKKSRDYLFDISFELYKINDWNRFNNSSMILLQKSKKAKDTINLVKAYRYRAGYYKKTKIFDSSFYYYLKAEKIYYKINNKYEYANILYNKGIVQYSVNDYLGADLSLSTAYSILKNSDDKQKLFEICAEIGIVSNELKDYDKAIEFQKKALTIVAENKLDDTDYKRATCLNNIGYVYQNLKQYDKAIFNYNLALNNEKVKSIDPDLYALLVDNLAYSKLKSNNFKNLPKLFYESLKIRDSLQNKTLIVLSNIHLSEYYSRIGDTINSLKYANSSLIFARKSKIPIDILASLQQIAFIDNKNASKYSKDYIRISDSLQVIERNSKDRFARLQLETEEIKKENVFLEAKNRDILNYFMGTMAIAGLLFFMRAQRAKSRELILKQAQQKANEDIYKLIISQQGKIDEGRIMEKTRIAKELHDGVLGRMFGLRLNLDGLNHRTDDEAVAERIRCLEELKIIEQDLREISHELSREKYVLINNFVAIVNNLLEEQTKINTAVLSATIGEDIDWELLSNTTKINLYRILQESLQNINKYAQAKTIKVDLRKDKKGNLVLNIVDDGVGFETDKNSKGIGLKNIVTRTHESEGIIDIKSSKNKGTQIKVTVPLENKSIKI
jgi:signal transduction histidine kinase